MLTVVAGVNWGDEGKGRMVDLLASRHDIVVRYQGGNNAGHTIVNDRGKIVLNLLPSGVFHEGVVNVMGQGMVIDPTHLAREIAGLAERGVVLTPKRLVVSDRAALCLPWHVRQDILEEERLGDARFGSTRRGIGPAYADRHIKKCLRTADLRLAPDALRHKVAALAEWKDLTLAGGYQDTPIDPDAVSDGLLAAARTLAPFIADAGAYLDRAADAGKNVLFEAQLGALRDVDCGIYPYTTSSCTLAAYAPIGAGVPAHRPDKVIGVVKAYSSCVGAGPFTAEMFGAEGDRLREAGAEYGAATGRPRRVGPFDIPASRHGVRLQGATELALTKLDVLSYMERIPVCVAYEIDGRRIHDFPAGEALEGARPVIEYVDGLGGDLSACRHRADLPAGARAYIRNIEKALNCPVRYLSVGPARHDYIDLRRE
ncbi:MAG: adenylosuccinate synthase [Planctomycetes bacterium]|nr:adenylosuccinate synthase [Planctomycetota bacterium]